MVHRHEFQIGDFHEMEFSAVLEFSHYLEHRFFGSRRRHDPVGVERFFSGVDYLVLRLRRRTYYHARFNFNLVSIHTHFAMSFRGNPKFVGSFMRMWVASPSRRDCHGTDGCRGYPLQLRGEENLSMSLVRRGSRYEISFPTLGY